MVQRRGKQTRQDVSLILLDRALDLVTPLCHADSDLERLSRGSTAATAGSLAQPSDSTAVGWFELLCSQRAKGASFTIKKELKQALLEEQVARLGELLVDTLEDTATMVEKKQAPVDVGESGDLPEDPVEAMTRLAARHHVGVDGYHDEEIKDASP